MTKVAISASKNKLEVIPKQDNWVERTRGIMANAWKDTDPAEEINRMRDEWEEKVRELENELKKI